MSLKDLIRVCSSDIIFLLIHASYDGTCHVNSNLDTFCISFFYLSVHVPGLLRWCVQATLILSICAIS